MQPIPVHRLPVLPDGDILPEGAIPATRHIAQYAIKQQLVLLLGSDAGLRRGGEDDLLGGDLDGGVDGRVVVRDHERGGGQARGLVDEHVGALVVAVVSDDNALWNIISHMQSFEQLSGLGTREYSYSVPRSKSGKRGDIVGRVIKHAP